MNIYYHEAKDVVARVYVFPHGRERGFSLFRSGKGIEWTRTEMRKMPAKVITREKAMRIVGSQAICSVE